MPPRRSDQVEAAAPPARDPFAALPHALSLLLFALLPVDQRLRCAEVCRGWCTVVSDVSLIRQPDSALTHHGAALATTIPAFPPCRGRLKQRARFCCFAALVATACA
jgi:hypothetical protein